MKSFKENIDLQLVLNMNDDYILGLNRPLLEYY